MSPGMRIAYVIPGLEVGGTERQLVYLARGLARDHDVIVVCTRRAGRLAADLRGRCAIEALRLSGGWDPRLKRRLRGLFDAFRPDVVHSFMFGFDYPVNVAARDVGVPAVVSSRRQLATWKKRRHIRLQRRANRLVDCVVANCDVVARFASAQEGEKIDTFRVIHNGIDADPYSSSTDPEAIARELGIPNGRSVVGMVANFSPVKDHDLFVRSAAELVARGHDAHFLLVGDGPLRRRIERRIVREGLADRCRVVGDAQDVARLYGLMSVLVLCSRVEGFPNVVMEAMTAGVPVVAARVGGVSELIDDGVTGTLVDSRAPADFAKAIAWVLEHPEESEILSDAACRIVRERLGVDRMVREYAALYSELLGEKYADTGGP